MQGQTRILIVEDEILIAHQLSAKLQRFGYHVVGIVASGLEAIREAASHRPDLVLMDIVITGDMDGTEAGTIIRRDYGIPVIYLTAYADNETIARAERSGGYGYILKPFQEREVHAMIKLALNRYRGDSKVLESLSEAEVLGKALRSALAKVVLQVEGSDSLQLEWQLASAIERRQLEIFYQPQLSLSDGRIVGVEALLRWRNPEFGLLPPKRFIPLAEESGLIQPIGAWVLEQAALQVKDWQARFDPQIRLAVNTSIRQLR
jgi:AmiR/NasT family two-component response regulator